MFIGEYLDSINTFGTIKYLLNNNSEFGHLSKFFVLDLIDSNIIECDEFFRNPMLTKKGKELLESYYIVRDNKEREYL